MKKENKIYNQLKNEVLFLVATKLNCLISIFLGMFNLVVSLFYYFTLFHLGTKPAFCEIIVIFIGRSQTNKTNEDRFQFHLLQLSTLIQFINWNFFLGKIWTVCHNSSLGMQKLFVRAIWVIWRNQTEGTCVNGNAVWAQW